MEYPTSSDPKFLRLCILENVNQLSAANHWIVIIPSRVRRFGKPQRNLFDQAHNAQKKSLQYLLNRHRPISTTKTMKLLLKLALLSLLPSFASAQVLDIFRVTIVGNDTPNTTACSLLGKSLGPIVMDTLQALVPGLTDYPSPTVRRGLRVAKSKVHRELAATKMCSRKFCRKPASFQACYWNGCSCACGGNRRLILSDTLSLLNLTLLRTTLNNVAVTAALTIPGCTLGVVLRRQQLDKLLL